ncbi:hypothetical protein MMC17_002295 [Xylographa soralifera]|nr:hypothetical protein [Xylographa soralifera]
MSHKQKPNAKPCKFFAAGQVCKNGTKYRFSHDETPSLPPSTQPTCPLCKSIAASPYGILADCDDIFCLSCILAWKAKNVLEGVAFVGCPACHSRSRLVVPSTFLPVNAEVKNLLVAAQVAQLKQFKCVYFEKSIENGGKPRCHMFNDCAYAHFQPAGVDRFRTKRYVFTEEEEDAWQEADDAEEDAEEAELQELMDRAYYEAVVVPKLLSRVFEDEGEGRVWCI